MNAFVAFEVSARNDEVVRKLKENNGYFSSWIAGSDTSVQYILPSNCVWKPDVELVKAKDDIERVIRELNELDSTNAITLKSCIVLSATPWAGKGTPNI